MIPALRTRGVRVCALALSVATATAQLPDYIAPPGQTVLNTDFTMIQPTVGPAIPVYGGVFHFRNVTVPAGSTLLGVGSRPMLWIVDNLIVDGELSVSGADGAMVNTPNSVRFPAAGGRGGAAGGNGGAGSPQVAMRSFAGQSGNGPANAIGMGGTGGLLSSIGRGSGGGGGAFATAGDPYYGVHWVSGTSFVQQLGLGGHGDQGSSGSATRMPQGGGPGGSPFANGDDNDDFFGNGVDVFQRRLIRGELAQLVGGAGGGGGGDLAFSTPPLSPGWIYDSTGGGGGGGGGCLMIVSLVNTTVGPTGRITANGGHGGGGEQAGSCNKGGGGGGGAGGLIIVASLGQIVLNVHGETYANLDYDFVLSADGGVCRTGTFGTPVVTQKYPQNGLPVGPTFGTSYDSAPLGGFGGMGVIQLMTPIGNNSDGTNTVLDDNIVLVRNGLPLTGALKQRFLAWRGFKDPSGTRVDDAGAPTNIGANEGDMRPSPVLLPLF